MNIIKMILGGLVLFLLITGCTTTHSTMSAEQFFESLQRDAQQRRHEQRMQQIEYQQDLIEQRQRQQEWRDQVNSNRRRVGLPELP